MFPPLNQQSFASHSTFTLHQSLFLELGQQSLVSHLVYNIPIPSNNEIQDVWVNFLDLNVGPIFPHTINYEPSSIAWGEELFSLHTTTPNVLPKYILVKTNGRSSETIFKILN